MILRLQRDPARAEIDSLIALARDLGATAVEVDAEHRLAHVDGILAPPARTRLEDHPAVAGVVDEQGSGERFRRLPGRADTVVRVGAAAFGGGALSIIAGPCAVEGRERLLEIAHAVRGAGATLLRGGAYKPRTSPYSFRGLGPEGLELLAEARAETGLGVVTEVLDPRDIERVAEVADVLQIGARSMTNFALLDEVGRTTKPVLLKRGFMATAREFLFAAEYVLAGGNESVILCERGVRGFDTVTRNLLDVGAVAWLKQETHLPVIVDPSHAAGRARLVPALALAGVAAGADGLLIEVHTAPSEARSDADQAISPETLVRIVDDVRAIAAASERRLVTGTQGASGSLASADVPAVSSRNDGPVPPKAANRSLA